MFDHQIHPAHVDHRSPPLGDDADCVVSLILPVRDCADEAVRRVETALDQMATCLDEAFEMVVVDDGSQDQTIKALQSLSESNAHVRVVRHDTPRGLESAGQTGLERSVGEVVMIAENEHPLRCEDLKHLLRMSQDRSVVAARAESTVPKATSPLVRRLRANVVNADQKIDSEVFTPIQMVRRCTLQYAVHHQEHVRLRCEAVSASSDGSADAENR